MTSFDTNLTIAEAAAAAAASREAAKVKAAATVEYRIDATHAEMLRIVDLQKQLRAAEERRQRAADAVDGATSDLRAAEYAFLDIESELDTLIAHVRVELDEINALVTRVYGVA